MEFQRRIETISTPSVDIDLFFVPWDSEILGFGVAQLERIVVKSEGGYADALSALGDWFIRHDIRLASCRLPSDRLRESMLLESCGFRFVEMVCSPTLSPLPAVAGDDELVVGNASPRDAPDLEAIASSAFVTGRFFLDWRLDRHANGRRYQQWVRNSFADARQQVLKATIANDIVGFFIVEHCRDRDVYWHLTAIAPSWQGKGMGKRLWMAMVARHRAEGLERIETTISAHNTQVVNIYAGLGFKFAAPQMTFHWLRG